MLTLNRRPCKIGTSINTRTELHGDESVPAMDIPLAAIMLTAEELNALLGEPHAHDALFNDRADKLAEPLFPQLKPLRLSDKFEKCSVSIEVGLNRKLVEFEDVKLARLTLQPMVGGLTELTLQVQCTPDLDEGAATLLAWLNRDADVEIVIGERSEAKTKQPELALDGDPGADKPKRRGRPPKSHGVDPVH